MSENSAKVQLEYFSDVLCVWAYGAQARVDELRRNFAPTLSIQYRFIPLFAAARSRVLRTWGEEHGFEKFNRKLREIVSGWDHVQLYDDLWIDVRPASSTPAQLFLKAVQLLERRGVISSQPVTGCEGRSAFEQTVWRVREAFFRHGRDVASGAELELIARDLQLPLPEIEALLGSGEAHAELQLDREAQERYHVAGSPTYVLDGGRQHLYGNVGYHVLEANVRELLRDPQYGEASWC